MRGVGRIDEAVRRRGVDELDVAAGFDEAEEAGRGCDGRGPGGVEGETCRGGG